MLRNLIALIKDFFNDVDRNLNGLSKTLKKLDKAEAHQTKKANRAEQVAMAAVAEHEARLKAARRAAAVRNNISGLIHPEE